MPVNNKHFAANLAWLAERWLDEVDGRTLSELAEASGVGYETLRRYLSGVARERRRTPQRGTVRKLVKFFGVAPNFFDRPLPKPERQSASSSLDAASPVGAPPIVLDLLRGLEEGFRRMVEGYGRVDDLDRCVVSLRREIAAAIVAVNARLVDLETVGGSTQRRVRHIEDELGIA